MRSPASVISPAGREAERAATWRGLTALAVVIHLLYSANFLYFFVDDEAIPFVYAQNLLAGHGLSYNVVDGPVEGYSDFLHVWLSTILLGIVRLLHLEKYWVFFIGKGISIVAGALVIVLTAATLRHLRVRPAGLAGSLGFLALAGPLAVWSCSSLETVPFTLVLVTFVWSLVTERNGVALVSGAIMCLDRIDGFVYVAAILAAFAITAARDRRQVIGLRLAVPLGVLLAVYNGWRVIYFHDWLPMPLRAKVLYKLTGGRHLVRRAPASPYWVRFLQIYGWPAGVLLLTALIQSFRAGSSSRAIAHAAGALFVYVSVVGDWMFGFRFFVALLPLMAVVVGCASSALAARHPRAAQAVALGIIVWAVVAVRPFIAEYRFADHRASFLQARSLDLHRFFFPYFSLYELARDTIPLGEIVAYNQSGFLPFMLDLRNIDDLGICTRFYAEVPTTDVLFTEVGRYEPLTDKAVLTAGQAYLLYRDVQFILVRTDLLRHANRGVIPPLLLNGFFKLVDVDREDQNAIFRRTAQPAGPYATEPGSFVENVAHISRLTAAMLNDVVIRPSAWSRMLPFLSEGEGQIPLTDRAELSLVFSTSDEAVRAISIDGIRTDVVASVELTLWSKNGAAVFRQIVSLPANEVRAVHAGLPPGLRAARFTLDVTAATPGTGSISINDLRIQGQRQALEQYIARALRFPRPGAPAKRRG